MAFLEIQNIAIKGLSACVPKQRKLNIDLPCFSVDEAIKFIATTGIEQRRIANEDTCTSDLCYHAAEKLIADLEWEKSDIDCLVFVTQTPDYILPATSCTLQQRLNLKESCFTLDISLGCSGWIYGLSVISSILSASKLKRGILLVGDTISKLCSVDDKSTYPLFGDAGSATAIEYNMDSNLKFHLATSGEGADAIKVLDGGFRNQTSNESFVMRNIEEGISRNNLQLILDGMNVFSFGISKAPESVNSLISNFALNKDQIDNFIFHQANKFMNEKIRKKLQLSEEKVPYSLARFGNTSSCTIPLTMVTEIGKDLSGSCKSIIACGFGVGLSWGSVHFMADHLICSDLIEI